MVANELHSRKDRVWLVAATGDGGGDGSGGVRRIDRPPADTVIESQLVAAVVAAHRAHMAAAGVAEGGGGG